MAERHDSHGAPAGVPPRAPSRSAAQYRGFLFADLRGYTDFVERRGNAAAADLLEAYRLLTRAVVARHDGAEVKTEGDSFYVVFPSASGAVECAVELVADAAEASRREPDRPIRVGVGVHAGETVETPEGFVGAAVNLAARVCAQAGAGEVIVTETVRSMAGAMLDLDFKPLGRRRLKGVHEPVMLYQVAARAEAAAGQTRFGRSVGPPRLRASLPGLAAVLVVAVGLIAIVGYRVVQGEPAPSSTARQASALVGSAQGGLASPSSTVIVSPALSRGPSPSVGLASSAPFVRPLTTQVKIGINGAPRLVAATTDAIWVAVDDPNANLTTLNRIDPGSNQVTDQIVLTTTASSIAGDGRDLWVALKANQIIRIDGRTKEIAGSVQVNDPYDLAVRDGSIWVTASVEPGFEIRGHQTTLVRVDTRTKTITKTIDLGRGASDVVATADAVWVSGEAIWRVDPVDGHIISTLNISSRPLAVGFGSIWVVNAAFDILRLDPSTGHEQARMAGPPGVQTLYADRPWLWAEGSGAPAALLQFDPATDLVTAGTTLGQTGTAGGVASAGGIAGGFGSVWVCDAGRSELLRIKPEP